MDKRKRRLLCMLEGSGRKSRWISGAPPLSFKALAAGTLENYRIYGNTVGGESVGDLVESGEHAGEYKVPVTVSNGTDTLTTPIYLPEQMRKVGDEAEYIDYAEQKQHRVRKNLLQNTATSQEINGVTFTVNSGGSITCNGTANVSAPSILYIRFTLPIKLYELSGCPDSGSDNTYRVDIRNIDYSMYKYNGNNVVDYGTGCLFDGGNNQYCIRIAPGYTCNNLTFYPMIRKADIEDDTYEPYIENTDLDVTLPALPILTGTNVLSVGTAVQPSEIEVKGKIKAL